MKIVRVLRFRCDHCGRGYWKKEKCIEHEDRCSYNPINKCCGSCHNATNEEDEGWYCEIHDKMLTAEWMLTEINRFETIAYKSDCRDWKDRNKP